MYNRSIDYSKYMHEAAGRGDYGTAAYYEGMRNQKIDCEGLDFEKTYDYSYMDPTEAYDEYNDDNAAAIKTRNRAIEDELKSYEGTTPYSERAERIRDEKIEGLNFEKERNDEWLSRSDSLKPPPTVQDYGEPESEQTEQESQDDASSSSGNSALAFREIDKQSVKDNEASEVKEESEDGQKGGILGAIGQIISNTTPIDPVTGEPLTDPANREGLSEKNYESIPWESDYEEKSEAVTDGRYDGIYDYINNIGDTRERVYNEVGAENNGLSKYELLTGEEVGTYNYIYATSGKDEADKYLKSLGDILNQRLGDKIAEDITAEPGLGYVYGLQTGVDKRVSKFLSMLDFGDGPNSATSYSRDAIRQGIADNGGSVQLFDELESIGYSLPEIVAILIGTFGGTGKGETATYEGVSSEATETSGGSLGNVTEGAGELGKKTIVIGETMKRVQDYAKTIDAEVYGAFKYYDKTKAMFGEKLANFIGGVDNALWLIDKMVHKYKIVDLGLDVERAIHSPYYLMESVLSFLYKYKEYAEDFMKGAF